MLVMGQAQRGPSVGGGDLESGTFRAQSRPGQHWMLMAAVAHALAEPWC